MCYTPKLNNVFVPKDEIYLVDTKTVVKQDHFHFSKVEIDLAVLIHRLNREIERVRKVKWVPGAAVGSSCFVSYLAVHEEDGGETVTSIKVTGESVVFLGDMDGMLGLCDGCRYLATTVSVYERRR